MGIANSMWLRVFTVAMLALAADARAKTDADACPAAGVSWTIENLAQCISDATKQIEQAAERSAERAKLLARRARLYEQLGSMKVTGSSLLQVELNSVLADYAAALEIAPQEATIRYDRARLLLRAERGAEALKDGDILSAQTPDSINYQTLKGDALAMLKRYDEAINVFTRAITLAQSCAEASAIQSEANGFRHAFDPPPQTKEEALQEIEKMKARPLYDVPEAAVVGMGFPCAPSPNNAFADMVTMKSLLYERRAGSHRALGNKGAALRDYDYAVLISPLREFGSLALCELGIDMQDDFSATENCRRVFDFNTYPVLADGELAAKIGAYLLEDGDLKGACRIAFPFFRPDATTPAREVHPKIKALQERLRGALKGAGLTRCDIDLGRPPVTK